jgi:hypothetical protein
MARMRLRLHQSVAVRHERAVYPNKAAVHGLRCPQGMPVPLRGEEFAVAVGLPCLAGETGVGHTADVQAKGQPDLTGATRSR